jgi:hypothetical protein
VAVALALARAYRYGGRAALLEKFAKLYPDKVRPLPEQTEQEPAA